MKYSYFEIITVLFECILLHIFFNAWFGTRYYNSLKTALFLFLYCVLHCFVSLLPIQPVIRTTISYFLVLAIASALYDTTRSSAVYSSLLYMALAVVSEYLCLALLNVLKYDTSIIMFAGNARGIYLALAKTVNFTVVLTAATILRKNRAALTFRQIASLLPCLIVSIYICIVFLKTFSDSENELSLTLVIALIGLLYINGIIVLNTQSIKRTVVKINEQKLAVQQYEMQEQYYRNVIKDREETRALWHDVKKYVTAIEAMILSGNTDAAKKEYEAMHQAFNKLGWAVDVENETLNIILYHNIQHAKEYNISVHLSVQVPSEIPISAVDLSVILGNTFDNSIDECLKFDDKHREIRVTIIQQNNMLFYEIKNPRSEASNRKSGKHHGYGLDNIKRCIKKYDGSMVIDATNAYYCVSIRLNCPLN